MSRNSANNINRQARAILLTPFVGVNKIFNHEDLFRLNSSLASDRLQIKPLIKALGNLGYRTSAASLNTTFHLSEFDQLQDFDLCIASKMRSHESIDDNLFSQFHTCCALHLKRHRTKLITIYSDHVTELKSIDSELYKNLLYLSDHVITPSKKLKISASKAIAKTLPISIIEDPCQLRKQEFNNLNPGETIQILWFGNSPNLEYLLKEINGLFNNSNQSNTFQLTILTSKHGLEHIERKFNSRSIPKHWSLRLVLWNINNQPEQLESELSRANISLLPSDPLDPRKNGVSHNRLLDSIQSGCIAIASPVDSYIELSKVSLIGENFPKLLDFAVENYPRLCNKYSRFRDAALQRFNPELNIKKWEAAIQQTMNSAS
jgi:hypothetical protein